MIILTIGLFVAGWLLKPSKPSHVPIIVTLETNTNPAKKKPPIPSMSNEARAELRGKFEAVLKSFYRKS